MSAKMLKLFLLAFGLFVININFCLAKNFSTLNEKTEFYKNRYKVNCLNEKITNNFGNGFDDLYGTRNMRPILFGIAYRGGANNFYHKNNKRDNQNPLPNDGLENLKNEGFSTAIYLYGKNFPTAPKFIADNKDTLQYIQNSGMNRNTQKEIMQMVQDRIENPNLGPMYLHCWNGWHQSGYVAAIILMQYCGFSNTKAREYWEINTDGAYKKFDNIKQMIANFTPFKEFQIDKETQEMICPCMK
jgi:hypothetical protein